MSRYPCAGVIVFDNDKTVVVTSDRNRNSFPKGKRNRKETDLETAFRELEEETGLTHDHVELIEDFCIDETSNNNHPSVRYFVGKLVKPHTKFTFDEDELQKVEWHRIEDALKLEGLKDRRKEILGLAHAKFMSHTGWKN